MAKNRDKTDDDPTDPIEDDSGTVPEPASDPSGAKNEEESTVEEKPLPMRVCARVEATEMAKKKGNGTDGGARNRSLAHAGAYGPLHSRARGVIRVRG